MSPLNASCLQFSVGGRSWRVAAERAHDLSIPLEFDAAQPNFFGAPHASASPFIAGSFIGDVREGGSCNCATLTLTPHCNGTHTECLGHVTSSRIGVRDIAPTTFALARLVTIAPVDMAHTQERSVPLPHPGDALITRAALEAAVKQASLSDCTALVVRTTPNPRAKLDRSYGPERPPPYFSADAMRWIVSYDIEHLVVDLPSVDRAADEGHLTTHRIFWGLAPRSIDATQAGRPHATITELAYIDDEIADDLYLLNLQFAPFRTDAAPSRPLLLPLTAV